MSIKKATEFYESLDPNQKQFLDEKVVNASYSIRKWLGFLSKAAAYDTYGDKAIRKIKNQQVTFIILAVVSFIITFFFFYALPLVIVFLLLILRNSKQKKRFIGRDLNNYLRSFFFPVLELLKEHAGENAKLSASLNFNDLRDNEPEKGVVRGRKLKTYEGTYIISKVVLKDQSILEFVVGDVLKDMKWTKTSASGKTKFKSKSKVAHLLLIKLTVLKSSYPKPNINPEDGIEVEENTDAYVLKAKYKIKKIGADLVLSPEIFFNGLKQIYGTFKPSLEKEDTEKPTEFEEEDGVMQSALMAGTYFDTYDYDSFNYSDSNSYYSDEEGSSIFDS